MASNSNSGIGGWKPNQQNSTKSGSGYWTNNPRQEHSNAGSSFGGWAFNSGQNRSDSQASDGWANSSGQSKCNYGSGGASGWTSNTVKGSSSSGGWQNKSSQSTSSFHQDENPINWDGLVEDEFKKEIGRMAEDLKVTKPALKGL